MDLPSGFLQWPPQRYIPGFIRGEQSDRICPDEDVEIIQYDSCASVLRSGNWQVLAGIMPAYWPMKMTWLADQGNPYGAYGAAGVAVNAAILLIMLRKFSRAMHR